MYIGNRWPQSPHFAAMVLGKLVHSMPRKSSWSIRKQKVIFKNP